MEQTIPFSCIKNNISENDQKPIKCPSCNGVLYEPVLSLKDNKVYCKNCLYEINNINIIDYIKPSFNYTKIYKQVPIETKKYLNNYKYKCPNFDIDEKEYTYDGLINHLITCDNKKIQCPNCDNQEYIKLIKENEQLKNLLIKNTILERELEYQKSIVKEMEKEKQKRIEQAKIIKHPQNKRKSTSSKNIKITKNPDKLEMKKMDNKKVETINYNKKEKIKKTALSPRPDTRKVFRNEKKKENIIDNSRNTKLFDKCPHFYGNYMPYFICCNKFYGCYLCHNENEDHPYQFSNKVACLFCKNVYPGKTCTKCKANQLFQRKRY